MPQASITLDNSNAIVNQVQETSWDLEKTGALSDGTVTWTVKLKKAAVSDQFIKMSGFMTITNTGSAGATIGNIVVNLQTRCPGKKPKSSLTDWGSVSVDIADATHGDDATSALIVANATSETTTTCQGSDYTTSGQPTGAGKFTENSASGTLNFFDVDNDTIFSLVPPFILAPGKTINLLYTAIFDNSILGLATGSQIRTEAIVTFGNSGARGGNGASGSNIDINGDGNINCTSGAGDECNVRSVPTRISVPVPQVTPCGQTVTLSDLLSDMVATGTASISDNYSTDIGGGTGIEVIDGSTMNVGDEITRTITITADGGAEGGTITDCAHLTADPVTADLQIGVDPITGLPITHQIIICDGVDQQDCASVQPGGGCVPSVQNDFCTDTGGAICTYTQGERQQPESIRRVAGGSRPVRQRASEPYVGAGSPAQETANCNDLQCFGETAPDFTYDIIPSVLQKVSDEVADRIHAGGDLGSREMVGNGRRPCTPVVLSRATRYLGREFRNTGGVFHCFLFPAH